jgi:hypothetical protein
MKFYLYSGLKLSSFGGECNARFLRGESFLNKKGVPAKKPKPLKFVVPGARIELAQQRVPRDFKSLASTSSAIRAGCHCLPQGPFFCQSAKGCKVEGDDRK